MPDRYITPKIATYLVLFQSLIIAALAVWVVNLSGRVSTQEQIRAAEARGAAARNTQFCAITRAFVDVSIDLPLLNLEDILSGPLTDKERFDRKAAQTRYLIARIPFEPILKGCDISTPKPKPK